MTRYEALESRIDALEQTIRKMTDAEAREYMRLFLRGDKEGAKAMLRELDKEGGMQR